MSQLIRLVLVTGILAGLETLPLLATSLLDQRATFKLEGEIIDEADDPVAGASLTVEVVRYEQGVRSSKTEKEESLLESSSFSLSETNASALHLSFRKPGHLPAVFTFHYAELFQQREREIAAALAEGSMDAESYRADPAAAHAGLVLRTNLLVRLKRLPGPAATPLRRSFVLQVDTNHPSAGAVLFDRDDEEEPEPNLELILEEQDGAWGLALVARAGGMLVPVPAGAGFASVYEMPSTGSVGRIELPTDLRFHRTAFCLRTAEGRTARLVALLDYDAVKSEATLEIVDGAIQEDPVGCLYVEPE